MPRLHECIQLLLTDGAQDAPLLHASHFGQCLNMTMQQSAFTACMHTFHGPCRPNNVDSVTPQTLVCVQAMEVEAAGVVGEVNIEKAKTLKLTAVERTLAV
jgi:hypothetical protein